jgi:4-hydroxybenzoate polyprenyltransferase
MIGLARASHLQPTLAVTVIAAALALSAGRGAGAALVALAVLAGQLSIGWSNDYIDRDRDRRAGRMDKPIPSGEVAARTVRAGAIAAASACVPLSLLAGWRGGLVHLAAVAAGWTYNGWLKNTSASVLPFAAAFGALPAFVTLGLRGHPFPPAWATIAAAVLGAGAHFVNTLPDLIDDERTGIRGLPHRVGRHGSLLLGALLLVSATFIVAIGPAGRVGPLGAILTVGSFVAVCGVVGGALSGHPRAAWSFSLCAAGLSVAALLARGAALAP